MRKLVSWAVNSNSYQFILLNQNNDRALMNNVFAARRLNQFPVLHFIAIIWLVRRWCFGK